MCEEYESHHNRSGQLDVLMGQSIVLSEFKAEVLMENDIPSKQNFLLQRYEERIELFSEENKVSKFCMDAMKRKPLSHYRKLVTETENLQHERRHEH